MNFFQKLTGSLKMPAEEELFDEKSPPQSPAPTPQAPQFPTPEPAPDSKDQESEIKTASFKQMLASEESTDLPDGASTDIGQNNDDAGEIDQSFSDESEPAEANFTTRLASARAKKKRISNPLKRGLSSLRIKNDKEEETSMNAPEGQLAIDVYETPEEIVIKSTIAGVKPQDLDVGIEDNTVNIRGSRHNEEKVKGEDYFYQECYWGTFSRSVILPVEIDSEKTQAALKDGILTVRLPKIIKEKEKKIKILS